MKLAKRPVHTYTDYPSSQRVRYKLNKRVILSVRYIVVNVHHNFYQKMVDIIINVMTVYALLKLNWDKSDLDKYPTILWRSPASNDKYSHKCSRGMIYRKPNRSLSFRKTIKHLDPGMYKSV